MKRQYLQIPGPTNIPESIRRAMSKPAINHRGLEFSNLLKDLINGMRYVFQSSNDILIFPSSGSGGLEAAIVNLFSPGDQVIAVNMGVFSKRFGTIAEAFGLKVIWINVEWGKELSSQQLEQVLSNNKHKSIKGILLTHSETSTSILNDIAELKKVIDAYSPECLVLVDAVSSLAISDLKTDDIGIDVVITGSQKGLMLPGGLGILCVSKKALEANKRAKLPRWYWDFNTLKERLEQGRMVYTPAISLFYGLQESLHIIKNEGLQQVFNRHQQNKKALHQGITALGLDLLVENKDYRAESVTAIKLPNNVIYQQLANELEKLNIIIGGGLAKLQNKIFRVGHLGMLHQPEVLAIIGGLEIALKKCDYSFKMGTGSSAVLDYFYNNELN